jgi:hypothetical protein
VHQSRSKQYTGLIILIALILTVSLLMHFRTNIGSKLSDSANTGSKMADVPQVQFENKTQEAGLAKYTPTFSIVVSDIDGDGADDLFVGHHGYPPTLYLNRNLKFVEDSKALPPSLKVRGDRHGYTFVDFDNDGDKDFVVAGGGADGVGIGMSNEVYKNLLIEKKELEFVDVTNDSDISNPSGRTRELLPIENPKGDKVDLYSTGLHQGRPDSKNLYAINNSTSSEIRFNSDKSSSLYKRIESDGKDLFFDFDRDGLVDFLSIGQGQARLYRNEFGEFTQFHSVLDRIRNVLFPSELEKIWGVISAVSADLNNDGFPDLYLGRGNGQNNSDQVVNNSEEIHFSIQRQGDDSLDAISFKMKPARLKIDFKEHIPSLGKDRIDATNIYIGANKANPKYRTAQIGQKRAGGKPESMEKPGIYIWYEKDGNLWHFLWKHDEKSPSASKGIIYSEGIELVQKEQFETTPAIETQDYILINQKGKSWKLLRLDDLKHSDWTNYLTAADFNNDGFVDIVGVRTGADAQENGNPFMVLNHGNLSFTKQDILENSEDDIFHGDLIVHGFFNDDGLPDLFFTNGFGLLPGNMGPQEFWLNTTKGAGGYVLLELEGTKSNRDAIGAQVELFDMDGTLLGYKELGSNFGRGQNTHKIHFGLGDKRGPFYLKIRWPGGNNPQQLPVNANSFYHIRQN